MKNKLLVVMFSFFIFGCQPHKNVRSSFHDTMYCYNGSNSGIDTLIAINGYYEMYKPVTYFGYKKNSFKVDSSNIINDTSRLYCIFYKDGFFFIQWILILIMSCGGNIL
jgi:hypothetical protein